MRKRHARPTTYCQYPNANRSLLTSKNSRRRPIEVVSGCSCIFDVRFHHSDHRHCGFASHSLAWLRQTRYPRQHERADDAHRGFMWRTGDHPVSRRLRPRPSRREGRSRPGRPLRSARRARTRWTAGPGWVAGPAWSARIARPRGAVELHVHELRRRMQERRGPPHRLLRPHTKSGRVSGRTIRVLPRARRSEQPARRRMRENVGAGALMPS
jgi:hypothetical protein